MPQLTGQLAVIHSALWTHSPMGEFSSPSSPGVAQSTEDQPITEC